MTNKQISALISTGIVIFSTILCWPGDFDTMSAFYRALAINIANVFITEIPRFKDGTIKWINYVKSFFTLLGFLLLGISVLNVSRDTEISIWAYGIFWATVIACCISLLNFIEAMFYPQQSVPPVVGLDSTRMESEVGEVYTEDNRE